MQRYRQLVSAVITVAVMGVIAGCGTANHGAMQTNKTVTTNTSATNSASTLTNTAVLHQTQDNHSIVIYKNPQASAQRRSGQYTSYFGGTVSTVTSKQLSQEESGGHSPWKGSPIYVAAYGTQNFTPNSKGFQQISETSKELVGTYNGKKVTYKLVSATNRQAKVVERGLLYSLTVDLYKPVNHTYWFIDGVQLNS